MRYLMRKRLLGSIDEKLMWKKDLSNEEIKNILDKYEEVINSYEYEDDEIFIMDARREHMYEVILRHDKNKNSLNDINELMWPFWEFISEEYCGSPTTTALKYNISPSEVYKRWDEYKEKGVICKEEKDRILDMINSIKSLI